MDIYEALQDKVVRVEAMRDNFPLFFAYHYWWEFTDFQVEWMRSLQSKKNTFIEAFRASRKTTIVRWWVIWLVCYNKEPSIIWQSFEDSLSWESVREIAKMMCKDSIVDDYGQLFPFETKKEDLAKRSLSNFETTNGVKIASKSLWQTLRWANTFDTKNEISSRPTVLILDDIDVLKSVLNVEIINNNERKILGETIAALDPLRRKIVFLGNTILDDGIVPRFREQYKNSESWDCFRQPLFDEKWWNYRPEVFTNEVVETLKADGKTSWNQNYLLVPSSAGNGIFTRDYFDYFLLSHFEDVDSFLKKHDLRCWIFIDPAFSTSDTSDDAVIMWVWEHKVSKWYYLIDWYADTSAPSRTIQAVIVMYNNMVAKGFNPEFISCEDVTINKNQTQFINDLRSELVRHQINVPVNSYSPKLKKEQRIKDNLESVMSQKWIKFNRNISDTKFLPKIERQFVEFPVWDHDDLIDCLAQAIEVFRKRIEKQIPVSREVISAITNRPIEPTRRVQQHRPQRWYSWLSWRPL